MNGKIILTDYPKHQSIPANLRGCETEHLLKLSDELFHSMMCSSSENAGGYTIYYDYKEIAKELTFRNIKTNSGCTCKEKA